MSNAFQKEAQIIAALENSNVVFGVSLSNRAFNAKFCTRLCKLIIDSNPRSVLVFFGDEIEKINYTVFGKKSMDDAKHTAITRGMSLARMFKKACRQLNDSNIQFDIRLESEMRRCFFYGSDIEEVLSSLKKLMEYSEAFKDDVHAQVRHNLRQRERRYGSSFLDKNMSSLSEYVLGELAIFFSFYQKFSSVHEVYPGENLFVKERILNGRYPKVRGIKYDVDYEYHDLSFLSEK